MLGRLALLRDPPSFGLLALATLTSALGTWLAFVALTIDVFDRTESATWVSALFIADFLPAIVIGVAAGTLVDRMPRRRLMIASDLVRVAVFALLPFAGSAAVIVALAAVAGFATGFFRPAVYAGLPNLVPDRDLANANSILQTIENAAWGLGPILGGVLVAATGPDPAYWINAATFLVSAALLARIPSRLLQAAAAIGRGYWRDLADGFALIRRSRALLTVLGAWNIVMLATAGANVSEVVLAKDAFSAGDFGYGLLVGATGVGLAMGSLFAGSFLESRSIAAVYGAAIGLIALGLGAAAASPLAASPRCRPSSGPKAGVDARDAGRRRPLRRPARACPGDHAGRERRSPGVRARPYPVPGDGTLLRRRDHRSARGRQVDPDQRADPPSPQRWADDRRHLRRPLEPVFEGRPPR